MIKLKNMFRPTRVKIVILALLILVGIFAYNNFFKSPKPLQFREVKRQDIKKTVSSSGILTGKSVVNLKFKSLGKLAYINVKAGDQVQWGQVIAGLDTQDLSIKLQQALNTYRDKQAQAEKAEDDVKNHSQDETFAQKVSRTTAQSARDSAYDGVKEAQRAFQDAVIVSPIAGLVTQASPIAGQIVTTSDIIAQVVDFSATFFDTDIDEADIGKVSLGQKAEVNLDAYPDKLLKGSVDQIIPQIKTTAQGATVVTLRIKLEKPDIIPINGLGGQASIILSEAKNVLTIPQEALREDNTVFIQSGNVTRSQEVVPGIKSDTEVEIKEGLKEGDKVLLNPPTSGSRRI